MTHPPTGQPAANTGEGALLAHRKILAMIIAEMALRPDGADSLLDRLDDASIPKDHQEDPGAVPGEAAAIQGAQAEEFRLVAEAARRRLVTEG